MLSAGVLKNVLILVYIISVLAFATTATSTEKSVEKHLKKLNK
jgi:hypothetical protein